ncbi:hypothetical protein [Staphylococcus arlettae]|uniref:hypothetical protein n=1 Tax=Staphylococcus arlettae TaxID=29378 RepID=UPI0021D2C4E7|nr:hypothetical protein [Staphylococcus arlettae]UXU53223.1 hypothetical protein MUA71_03855 [Staphylococcus arlettae]
MTFESILTIPNKNKSLNIFNDISEKLQEFKKNRDKIENKYYSEQKRVYFESYLNHRSNDNVIAFKIGEDNAIYNRLSSNTFDEKRLVSLLQIRKELLDMEFESMNKDNIESMYIFEKSFYDDLEKDLDSTENERFKIKFNLNKKSGFNNKTSSKYLISPDKNNKNRKSEINFYE